MLKRKYGLVTTTLVAVSATLGSSILIAFGQVAFHASFNPILMLLAWALGGLLIIPGVLLFGETTSSYPENGTTYNWLKKANYQGFSFWFGWIIVLIVSSTSVASIAIGASNLIGTLFNITNSWALKGIAISLLALVALFHIFSKTLITISQNIFAILKFVPILFIILIAIIFGNFDNFHQDSGTSLKNLYFSSFLLIPAMAMTMFAYSGVEAVTYIAGEVKEPRKNIIRAKIIATAIVITVYLILALAIIMINVSNNLDPLSPNLWNDAILNSNVIPHSLALVFNILALLIFLGSLNTLLLYQSRMIHKLAQEKDLFAIFAKVRKKNETPYFALILLIALSAIYILWDQLYSIVTYFIIAQAILQIISFIVACQLRYKDSKYQRMFNNITYWFLFVATLISSLLALVGAILAMYVFARNNNDWWALWKCFIVIAVLLAGYPVYYIKNYLQKIWINYQKNKKPKKSLD